MVDFILWPNTILLSIFFCRHFCCFFHGWSTYTPLLYPLKKQWFNKALLRETTNGIGWLAIILSLCWCYDPRSCPFGVCFAQFHRYFCGLLAIRHDARSAASEFSPTRMVVKSWGFFMATKKSEVFPRMCFLEEVVYLCVFFGGGHPFEVWSQKKMVYPFFQEEDFLPKRSKVWSFFGNLWSKNGPVRACNFNFWIAHVLSNFVGCPSNSPTLQVVWFCLFSTCCFFFWKRGF